MRPKSSFMGLTVATLLALSSATARGSDDSGVETILILAQREARTAKGATGLELSVADTPQSESIIDRETMDIFGLDDINSLLRVATGVNVESVETDRTYYNARGFDITSMQVDGVGMPFGGIVVGGADTALYEKVEIVRGANGLLTGIGNPSGTINYVRKRPTNQLEASAEVTYGSWDRKRVEADLSAPLVASGAWAARMVGVIEDRDSWLNLYHTRRKLLYGVVDGQLGERVTVTAGFSHQDSDSDGVLWGAFPLLYSDGTQSDYDVSTTTSQQWTYWDTHATTGFAELDVELGGDWRLKSVANYGTYYEPAELFYIYGVPDRATGLGLYAWPGSYTTRKHSALSDTSVAGSFELFGQQHQATLGLSLAKSGSRDFQSDAPQEEMGAALPAFPGWDGTEIPRPDFSGSFVSARADTHIDRLYGATRLTLLEPLKLLLGFNAVDAKTAGFSYGVPGDKRERSISPYAGVTWRVLPQLNLYASYSDIFQPQSEIDAGLQPLGSAKGSSYEAGVKAEWLDRRLLTTLALFKADQSNFAEFAGYAGENFSIATYQGISIHSQGYELEVAGKPFESLSLQAGWTQLSLHAPDGSDTRTFIPRRTLKLLASWKVPTLIALEVGASLRWQDDIHLATDSGLVRQGAYGVFGAQTTYRMNEYLQFGLNIENLTDRKYLSSLQWDQAFYGAPRSVNASIKVSF